MSINNIQCHDYAIYADNRNTFSSNKQQWKSMPQTCWQQRQHDFIEQMVSGHTMFGKQQKKRQSQCTTTLWSCQISLYKCTHSLYKFNKKPVRSELPSEILLPFHFQMSSSQIFFARYISTRWCGVHTLFRESHLSAHFDFRTHGGGGHLCGVQSMLSFRVIALATTTRR